MTKYFKFDLKTPVCADAHQILSLYSEYGGDIKYKSSSLEIAEQDLGLTLEEWEKLHEDDQGEIFYNYWLAKVIDKVCEGELKKKNK